MKTFSYILRLTLTLLIITVVVAGLLGLVNFFTEDKIAENTARKAEEAMQEVLPADSYEKLSTSGEGVTEAFRAENGYVIRIGTSGFGGAIDMMVGVSNEGAVTGISIISHSETPSLGANCVRPEWQAQFVGATGDLAVSKDGGTIDALTGATVTSRGVTQGVNLALAYVKEVAQK